ncbi:MAG TPA: DUF3126 family protein [Caulobacterales bacterium]|nr:DUF3126 family protein [Caulobacterales bacterium]
MDNPEIERLQAYLRRLLGASGLGVRAEGAEEAAVLVGDQKIAEISKDDDEGELSYFFNMGLPRAKGAARNAPLDESERTRLQAALREKLGAPKLEVRQRPRKTDSAEVYVEDEFIGTLSADPDSAEIGYFLTMSILDIDLQ